MRINRISSMCPSDKIPAAYEKLADELEAISDRYGIALLGVDAILVFDSVIQRVEYDRNYVTGELKPRVRQK